MEFVAEKTDPALLERLRVAAQRKLTRHEIEQQRVSFVYSVMCRREGMTRERVEQMIQEQQGA